MASVKKNTSLVGLDIESGSVAATEVRRQRRPFRRPDGDRAARAGRRPRGRGPGPGRAEPARSPISSPSTSSRKSVRLGIANQRVVVRTLRLPRIEDPDELDAAVRFRAQDEIPMPLDQAVLDHRVIGRGESADGNAADRRPRRRRAPRHDPSAGAGDAGRRPQSRRHRSLGLRHDPGARRRERRPVDESGELPVPTTLYCHLGDVTNIAVARGGDCLFTRVSPFGVETIADRLASREGISTRRAPASC